MLEGSRKEEAKKSWKRTSRIIFSFFSFFAVFARDAKTAETDAATRHSSRPIQRLAGPSEILIKKRDEEEKVKSNYKSIKVVLLSYILLLSFMCESSSHFAVTTTGTQQLALMLGSRLIKSATTSQMLSPVLVTSLKEEKKNRNSCSIGF